MALRYRNRRHERLDAVYARACLVTFGLVVLGIAACVLYLSPGMTAQAASVLVGGLSVVGIALIGAGVMGTHRSVTGWADAATAHDAAVVILLLAWPVYRLMKPFYRR